MSDRDTSKEQLIEEVKVLRQELALQQAKQQAFDAQDELFKTMIALQQTGMSSLMFKGILQKILKLCNQLTGAEEGSLFVLDTNGIVTESILARGATIREEKQTLIGQVLDGGLAGWTIRNRQFGLIADTSKDERWLTLPNQPYTVRSVLCVPILTGKNLLGIITLMHSKSNHFSAESVQIMQMMIDAIALVIDNTQFYSNRQSSKPETPKIEPRITPPSSQQTTDLTLENNLDKLGIYIITADTKFMYMNPRVAEIFGYSFSEFVALESLLSLIVSDDRQTIKETINRCIDGGSKQLSCSFTGQRKSGRLIEVKLQGAKTNFYGKPVIIGVVISQ